MWPWRKYTTRRTPAPWIPSNNNNNSGASTAYGNSSAYGNTHGNGSDRNGNGSVVVAPIVVDAQQRQQLHFSTSALPHGLPSGSREAAADTAQTVSSRECQRGRGGEQQSSGAEDSPWPPRATHPSLLAALDAALRLEERQRRRRLFAASSSTRRTYPR